jgi:MGT family glycosyltransferase
MAVIALLLDGMEGHYLPTFKLAKELRARGHEVCYLGLAGAAPMVRREGFELAPILGSLLPAAGRPGEGHAGGDWFASLVSGEALDAALERIRPAVVIMLSIYYCEAMVVHVRYRLPVLLLTTFCRPTDIARADMIEGLIASRLMELKSAVMAELLRLIDGSGNRFRSFQELAQMVVRMPELVLLPRALELPGIAGEPHLHYIGTGIDLARSAEPFPWEAVDTARSLVFCSLGSHAEIAAATARRFFHAVVGAAADDPQRQFILAVGRAFDPAELGSVPGNLYLSQWVPQLEVLRRADLMVTHGGAGTAKECVLMGVPMVVMPLVRDQFEMARRIVHHGLGVAGDASQSTAGTLGALIGRVAVDEAMRRRLATWRDLALREDRAGLGVEVVEAAVSAAAAAR